MGHSKRVAHSRFQDAKSICSAVAPAARASREPCSGPQSDQQRTTWLRNRSRTGCTVASERKSELQEVAEVNSLVEVRIALLRRRISTVEVCSQDIEVIQVHDFIAIEVADESGI